MISLILIAIAAALNALMDTLFVHFESSIFRKLDPEFWNGMISSKHSTKIPVLKYPIDAWHLTKSSMIFCYVGAAVLYSEIFGRLIDFCLFGVSYVVVFNCFYNLVLRRRRRRK